MLVFERGELKVEGFTKLRRFHDLVSSIYDQDGWIE